MDCTPVPALLHAPSMGIESAAAVSPVRFEIQLHGRDLAEQAVHTWLGRA